MSEANTDSCSTAVSGLVYQSELNVSFADTYSSLALSSTSAESALSSSEDLIPNLSDGKIRSVNDPFTSDDSIFSLTTLSSSLFEDLTSELETKGEDEKSVIDSSSESCWDSEPPEFDTSDIQTRFDDDYSYEYEETKSESGAELLTGVEYESGIWDLETGHEKSDPEKSIGLYTAIDRSDIRM